MSETLNQIRFRIDGMDCASCAAKIDTAVRRVRGIEDVSVSVTAGTMTVSHDGTGDLDKVASKVRSLGYGVEPLIEEKKVAKHEHSHDHSHHDHDHDHDHDHGACGGEK
jgi:Cd2+/Zn2+-exporting ATPase